MWWPGGVYDGAAAKEKYTVLLGETPDRLGVILDLQEKPIHSLEEADSWIRNARSNGTDGLMLLQLDRQQHTWPTAALATDSGIPTIIFSPLGSSFTTNTIQLAEKPGSVIYSTDDSSQPAFGMKMLAAAAKMRRCRCVVLKGDERRTDSVPDFGIELQYLPATEFLSEYRSIGTPEYVISMASDYMAKARVELCPLAPETRAQVFFSGESTIASLTLLRRDSKAARTLL
jgi:hypothetical protein